MNKEEITHSQSDEERDETFTKDETEEIRRITTEVMEKKIEDFVKDMGPCVMTMLTNLLRNELEKTLSKTERH